VSKRASAVAIIVVLGILAARGGEAVGDAGFDAASAQDGSPSTHTVVEHDDLFAEVAAAVPGFGGLFLDESGVLNVYLLDPAQEGATTGATAAIAAVFGPDRFPQVEVRAVQGAYGFSQLYEWRKALRRDVLGLPGVTTLDIDDLTNRLRIGVEAAEVEARVEEELARLGIPREAVDIAVESPAELAVTLQQYFRPVRGAFQIRWQTGGVANCTLGFNAKDSGNRSDFVTASHCSSVRSHLDNDLYFQPFVDAQYNNLIGSELSDPPFWTGAPCPGGRQCRWSDSLLAMKSPVVSLDQGGIARTTGANNGSILVDAANPRFRVTAENARPAAGEILNKVGKTTGWTQGAVDGVCVDVAVVGTNITLLCQDRVAANAAGGDSGSPVFRITNSPAVLDVKLYGVEWGIPDAGHFWFSAMYNVQIELGQLNTCASGFTC
jgi:transposase-like protein